MSLSLGPMKAGRHINLTGDYSWRQNKRVEKGFRSLSVHGGDFENAAYGCQVA